MLYRVLFGYVLASAFLISPLLGDGLAIVGTELSDNGDDDGFADTYESDPIGFKLFQLFGVPIDARR